MSSVINEEILVGGKKQLFRKGALVSFIGEEGEKIFGIIDGIERRYTNDDEVWAYWQAWDGVSLNEFNTNISFVKMKQCTSEKNWSRIKGFKNIPDFALIPKK